MITNKLLQMISFTFDKLTEKLKALIIVSVIFLLSSCSEKLVKEIRQYENGHLKTYEYLDINGNIVERVRINNGIQLLREEYSYVDNKIRAAQFQSADNTVSSVEYFYDKDVLMRTRYFVNGTVLRLVVYRYNEFNQLFSEMHYDLQNELRNITHFHYDDAGHLIAKVIITKDSLPVQEFYNFDEAFNVISSVKIFGNDTIEQCAYAYNKKNQVIQFVQYQSGNLIKHVKYSYTGSQLSKVLYLDKQGLIIREEKSKYQKGGRVVSKIITDYRNYDGDQKKIVDEVKYKYTYF